MAISQQFQPQNYGQGGQYSGGQYSPVQQYTPNQGSWWDSISEFFTGTPESYDIFNKFNPQQMQGLEELLSSGLANIRNPYEGFEPLQQETMNKFYQDILPGIKEQFTGQRGGALSSPDFQSQLSSGASGLAAMLNAQKARYGMANRQFGLQAAQQGLTPQFDIQRRERTPGLFSGENIGNNMQTILKLLPMLL